MISTCDLNSFFWGYLNSTGVILVLCVPVVNIFLDDEMPGVSSEYKIINKQFFP